MSTLATHVHAAPRAGIFARIADAFHALRAHQARRAAYRQTVNALNALSERELADLGINPLMVEATARKAAYGKR